MAELSHLRSPGDGGQFPDHSGLPPRDQQSREATRLSNYVGLLMELQWSDWSQVHERTIESYSEARDVINLISTNIGVPAIVEIWDPSTKRSICIGVGREMTVVTYQDSLDPPYFVSLADRNAAGTTWFCYGMEEAEFKQSNVVAVSDGMAALKMFFEESGPPSNLLWERL